MTIEERLTELDLELPAAPDPTASYVSFVQSGSIAYVSGHGAMLADGSWITGKVGRDLGVDEAYEAARVTGLSLLATIRRHLGSLDRVARVIKVLGMVNCMPDFTEQSAVVNGFSDLIIDVFGDAGRHARSAIGVASLPMGIPVEVEAIIEVE
jgi:enamine deaminase RidA (YjgF/YER057c/UK114 family)